MVKNLVLRNYQISLRDLDKKFRTWYLIIIPGYNTTMYAHSRSRFISSTDIRAYRPPDDKYSGKVSKCQAYSPHLSTSAMSKGTAKPLLIDTSHGSLMTIHPSTDHTQHCLTLTNTKNLKEILNIINLPFHQQPNVFHHHRLGKCSVAVEWVCILYK